MGCEPGSKAYRAYNPDTRRVHISHDIVFDEEAQWKWDVNTTGDVDTDFIIEYTSVYQPQVITSTGTAAEEQAEPVSPSASPPSSSLPASGQATPITTPTAGASPVEFVSPPAVPEDDLDADHDDAPLRFRTIDNVLGPATPPGLAARELDEELLLVGADEPASFAEAQ